MAVGRGRASEPWRAWAEGLARGPVSAALGEQLGAALTARGLGEDAVVLVRSVRVRVRLRGRPSEPRIALGWSGAVATDVDRWVAAALAAGGLTERAAVFASPLHAERAALEARIAGQAPWWAERVVGERDAAAVIEGWIAQDPAAAPAAILALTRGEPERLARLVSAGACAGLVRALDRAWGTLAPTPPRSARATADAGARGEIAAGTIALRGEAGDGAPDAHRALLRACSERLAPVPRVAPTASRREPAAEADDGGPGAEARAANRPEEAALGRASDPDGASDPDSASAASAEAGAEGAVVDLGGSLFLLRPLTRHPWLADLPWPAWTTRLAAVWGALDRVLLDGVEPRLAERIRDAQAPLAAVWFADPARPAEAERVDEAERVLRELLTELGDAPRPLPPDPRRLARALHVPRPPPWDRLAAVVLRPGGVLVLGEDRAELTLPLDSVDLALRRAGWDHDPGFVPGLRRTVRFRFC